MLWYGFERRYDQDIFYLVDIVVNSFHIISRVVYMQAKTIVRGTKQKWICHVDCSAFVLKTLNSSGDLKHCEQTPHKSSYLVATRVSRISTLYS